MAKESKYKHTQKLLKIAIAEGGYTNVEIAKKAGLKESSGSLVSRWRNGKALATERQMQYFINEYGGQLKRRNTHLFYSRNLNTTNNGPEFSYHKIEGEELFSHKIPSFIKIRTKASMESIRAFKVVVIQLEQGYALVKLIRAGLFEFDQQGGKRVLTKSEPNKSNWIHGDSENSNWFFQAVSKCSDFDELVTEFQKYMKHLEGHVEPLIGKPMCSIFDTEPVKFSFYHKFMKLGLQSEHLPF